MSDVFPNKRSSIYKNYLNKIMVVATMLSFFKIITNSYRKFFFFILFFYNNNYSQFDTNFSQASSLNILTLKITLTLDT